MVEGTIAYYFRTPGCYTEMLCFDHSGVSKLHSAMLCRYNNHDFKPVQRPFYERWRMLEKEVIEPRNQERFQSKNLYYRYDMEPFRVRRKAFWLLSTVTKLLNEFIPKLSHDADGLIFQHENGYPCAFCSDLNMMSGKRDIIPSLAHRGSMLPRLAYSPGTLGWDDPYIPRTHEGLLKWKYADLNSVDFLFEIEDDRQLLFLYERGKKKLMEGYRVAFEEGSDPLLYSGKIIECAWDSDKQEWIFKRVRTDKSTPNDFNTYKKVMKSIRDNITEDILLNEINEIIRLPMYADRIRIDSKAHHHTNMARRRSNMSTDVCLWPSSKGPVVIQMKG
ncbi:Nucleic acid-binding, OB-fold [Sesbania bispinosa]|nr:Nucleic acid-binding, OB-fold [Sesbania bispinosa]